MAKRNRLFNETAEFKTLSAEWEKKLADAEFPDIVPIESETVLSPQIFGGQVGVESKQEYRKFCLTLLQVYPFPEYDLVKVSGDWVPRNKIIFELHADGFKDSKIEATLKANYGIRITRRAINKIIGNIKEDYLKKV